jgi:hypothetical protein
MTSHRLFLASFLTLGLLAVIGTFLILAATPEGLGLSDDSIAYVAGARSLLAGQGYREAWLESNQFVTHFPPGFSGTLALLGLTGLDPLRGARFLNALLFGLNVFLLGLLGWRVTKSSVAGIVLAALFVVNDSLLRVHAVAMSEPLFLFFSLLAFLCFALYFPPRSDEFIRQAPRSDDSAKRPGGVSRLTRLTTEVVTTWNTRWLVATGILTSLAYLTRYSGLALVATFVVALIILHDTWRKRLTSIAIFIASFVPLVLAWSIRNRIVAGNTTNRTLIWHPVTADTLQQGLRTFSEFLIPVEEWRRELFKTPEIFLAVIAIILIIVLAWILVNGLRRFFKPSTAMPEVIGFTNGLYIFGYLASVLFSISLFDASTPLKVRILAPVYLPLLLLLVGAGTWAWNRRQRAGRGIILGLATLIFSVAIVGQARAVADLSRGGMGFASFKWYDSKVMDYLKTLSPDITIYTNEPGAVYLYTGHTGSVLPDRLDPVTGQPRPGFETGAAIVQADVLSGRAALVIFDMGATNNQPDYLLLTQGLYLIFKAGGDEVYYAPPP